MDFSTKSRARVVAGTIAGTLFCIVVSTGIDALGFSGLTDEQIRIYITKDVITPLFLGGFFFFVLLEKIRQLALAQNDLQRIASIDGLTATLNRKAYTMLVEAWLQKVNTAGVPRHGALLVIDADYFKKINDTYGHQTGDRALIHIAQAITGSVRKTDLVGRVGGEEFGVFLPDAPPETVSQIAERIRTTVQDFSASGEAHGEPLSVSIGGVCFRRDASFNELFSVADRQLYDAKASGRNRIAMFSLPAAA